MVEVAPAPQQSPPVCIFDLDGTLCDITHRLHYIKSNHTGDPDFKADWDAFYDACHDDEPRWPIIAIAQKFAAAGYTIIIASGRSDKVADKTKAWLRNHHVPYSMLVMRPEGDFTPDHELKRSWFRQAGLSPQKVCFVIEDRKQVVEMWRSLGLTCLQVQDGDY
jgi:hypothetical protein